MTLMKRVALALWLPVLILAAWETGTTLGMLNRLIFPAPSTLMSAAGDMLARGDIQRHLGATLSRLSLGFLIGSISGLACGVVMALAPWVRRSLEPIISGTYATPKLSLLPMLMLFVGIGEPARVLLIAIGNFVLLAMQSLDAIAGVNRRYVELARNYGADTAAIIRKVYLPASLPQIFTGLRIAVGRSLTITIALELVSCPNGLGSMVWSAWQTFYTEQLYIGVLLSAALGTLLHFSLKQLEVWLVPWKQWPDKNAIQ
jgi:ABC-type nitrate/sulfonate/bicarbonate transport system permease component